jgi:hypothetical protein
MAVALAIDQRSSQMKEKIHKRWEKVKNRPTNLFTCAITVCVNKARIHTGNGIQVKSENSEFESKSSLIFASLLIEFFSQAQGL